MVINKTICNTRGCDATTNLIKATRRTNKKGITTQYYKCNPCNSKRVNAYYHTLTGEKKKRFQERANKWNREQSYA